MRVLLFHPSKLPPKDYGGTERVVLWLSKGLVERGHEVWVAAFPGSELPEGVRLLEISQRESSPLFLCEKLPRRVDLVHFMAPPGDEAIRLLDRPSIVTVHGNGRPGERFPANTVFLSQNHALRHGGSVFVHNGIDSSECVFGVKPKERGALFLSRTGWKVKNLRGAISYCEKAGVPLSVAGGHRPVDLRVRALMRTFFRKLGYRKSALHWEGPVSGRRKAALLAQSKALVFPILWEEPFGLVVVEALMSGTPVLASRRGSMPELISSQVGALIDTDEEWIDYLRKETLPWNSHACRDWAMKHFHYRVMAERYEEVYKRVFRGEKVHSSELVVPELNH